MTERARVLLLESLSVPTGLQEILADHVELVSTSSWAGALAMLGMQTFDVVLRHVGEDGDNSIRAALRGGSVVVYGRKNMRSEANEEIRCDGVFGFIELPPTVELAVPLVISAAAQKRAHK